MSKTVSLKIDGKDVKVPEGTNLIDAAEAAGIHIPNLCYLKGMRGIGACRMCLVDVEGMKSSVVGCITRVKEGMSVKTTSPQIEEMRKEASKKEVKDIPQFMSYKIFHPEGA